MEPKSKEQWRAFLELAMEKAPPISAARAIRPVSIREYVQALRKLESAITDKQRTMLVSHATAPGQVLTMSELAIEVGFPSYSAANLQYGLLAGKLADALGIPRPEYLVYVIASFDDDPETSESRAHMHPELCAALQQLGWVAAGASAQESIVSSASSAHANRPTNSVDSGSMLGIQQVINVLERRGFTRPEQSGLKVISLKHPLLSKPVYVKQSASTHPRLQAPLVLHPDYEQRLPDWLGIAGVERIDTRYYHNDDMTGFPKRINAGKKPVAYGIDLAFHHVAALEQFLARLTGVEQVPDTPESSPVSFSIPDDFDPQYLAVTDTERDALIRARIGQSDYRNHLLAYWSGCAVTGCSAPALLRASHIKPWRVATPAERLDPFNGLLLTPNLDLAFDQGLISFDDQGQILISENLAPDSACALNISPNLRLRHVEPRHHTYLAWHRECLFRN